MNNVNVNKDVCSKALALSKFGSIGSMKTVLHQNFLNQGEITFFFFFYREKNNTTRRDKKNHL